MGRALTQWPVLRAVSWLVAFLLASAAPCAHRGERDEAWYHERAAVGVVSRLVASTGLEVPYRGLGLLESWQEPRWDGQDYNPFRFKRDDFVAVSREFSVWVSARTGATIVRPKVRDKDRVGISSLTPPDAVGREFTVYVRYPAAALLDANSREFSVFVRPAGAPPTDAVSRELSVFVRQAGPQPADSVSREFSIFVRQPGVAPADAVSREFAVFVRHPSLGVSDAIAREFSLFIRPPARSPDDAVAREFSVFVREPSRTPVDANSREFAVYVLEPARNPMDAVSREFSVWLPLPEIELTVVAAPAEIATEIPVRVGWTIVNNGNGPAIGPWHDAVFLSDDDQPGDDVLLGRFSFVGRIEPGESLERAQDVTLPRVPEPGRKWLIVYADVDDTLQEDEPNQANNWLAIPVLVTNNPLPDLVVEDIEAPAEILFGQRLTARVRVKNVGDGPTNASEWNDRLQLQRDGTVIATADAVNPEFLEPGQGYWTTLSFTVPKGNFGTWTLRATADANQRVNEGNEGNNTLGKPIQIGVPDLPDLVASDVRAPVFGTAGEPLPAAVQWTVENKGAARTPPDEVPWSDAIYLSKDRTLSGDDVRIGDVLRQEILNPGEGYTQEAPGLVVPRNLPPGEYHVIVRADWRDRVYEFASEANNVAVRERVITIGGPTADLEPEIVAAPTEAESGDTVVVTFRVVNNGPDTADPSWIDRVVFSEDDKLDPTDAVLFTHVRSQPLKRDESYEVAATVRIPDCLRQRYYLFVQTDVGNAVYEGPYEDNNVAGPRAIDLNLNAPDLTVTTVTAPPQLEAGASCRVQWRVENAGDGPTRQTAWTDRVVLSRDETVSSDDRVLGTFTRSRGLGRGESYARDEELTLPPDAAGPYYIIVTTDSGDVVPECDREGNNSRASGTVTVTAVAADLAVTGLQVPASLQLGEPAAVSWSVLNQGNAATPVGIWRDTVYLSRDASVSGDDIVLAHTTRIGALGIGEGYSAGANVAIPLVAPDEYYVIVRTDSGNAVFEGTNEGNNDRATLVRLGMASVDLLVTAITAPTEADSGVPMTLSWTVTNQGPDATWQALWVDRVVLSRDRIVDGADRVLTSRNRVGALGAGESYTVTMDVDVPAGLTGDWYVIPVTDWTNQVPETDEFNNDDRTHLVTLSLPPPVDLVVESIEIPATGMVGEPVTVQYSVQNAGSSPAHGRWTDTVYLSADEEWDIDDPVVGRVNRVGPVAPGAAYSATLTAPLPAVLPGAFRILVRTNARRTLREDDYGNNLSASASPLPVDFALLPLDEERQVTFSSDRDLFFKTSTPADRTVRFRAETDDERPALDIFLAQGEPASRSRYEARSQELASNRVSATIPTTSGQDVYSLFGAAVAGATPGRVRADNVPFSVEAVSPESVGDIGEATLTLQGGRLGELIEARLVGNSVEISSQQVELLRDGSARVRFEVDRKPHGEYDLEIRSDRGWQATSLQVTLGPVEGVAPIQQLLEEPEYRRGSNVWQRGIIRNASNIDITNVVVTCGAEMPDLVIVSERPATSVPRKSDFPEVDWERAPVTNVQTPGRTLDSFVIPRLGPGESIGIGFMVRAETIGPGPLTLVVSTTAHPGPAAEIYYESVAQDARRAILSSPEGIPPDLAEELATKETWWAFVRPLMAEMGYLPLEQDSTIQSGGSKNSSCAVGCLIQWSYCKAQAIATVARCWKAGPAAKLCAITHIVAHAFCYTDFVCCAMACTEDEPLECGFRDVVCSVATDELTIEIAGELYSFNDSYSGHLYKSEDSSMPVSAG